MSIDEAIAHALEVAEKNEKRLDKEGNPYYEKCEKCAAEHRQLAEWLKELKQLREQKPYEDAISRRAVLNTLDKMDSVLDEDRTVETYKKLLTACYNDLPSVTPEHKKEWIPVSERLPEEMGTYMTTIDYGEHGLVTGQRYYYGRGLKWNDECVIAWMPLSEPYKAEMEGEDL